MIGVKSSTARISSHYASDIPSLLVVGVAFAVLSRDVLFAPRFFVDLFSFDRCSRRISSRRSRSRGVSVENLPR